MTLINVETINNIAQSKLNDANDIFAQKYDYDLRNTANDDHLFFENFKVEGDKVILIYKECTPHDCPYRVEIELEIASITDAIT